MVPKASYSAYTAVLDVQYADAAAQLGSYIDSFDWSVDNAVKAEQVDMVADKAAAIVGVYGNNAASTAAEFYEAAAASEGYQTTAVMGDVASPSEVANAVVAASSSLYYGDVPDVDSFRAKCLAALKMFIKRAANDTMRRSIRSDDARMRRGGGPGVRWARVPRGAETCAFCIMLASRGFVYYSKESADLFGHEHKNCDCDIICSFSDDGLEGYDPKRYLDMYESSLERNARGAVDTRATLNAMRRSLYPEQRDHINAVKRAWYRRTRHGG